MISPRKPAGKHAKSQKGFSLIEVTLAMGVLFFAAISMFGLLSVAAGVSQKSISAELARRISAEVFGDLAQSGQTSGASNAFFDVDGKQVNANSRVFETWYTILPCDLPGASTTGLKRVVVQVFHNPGQASMSPGASGLVVAPRPEMEVASFQFHLNK